MRFLYSGSVQVVRRTCPSSRRILVQSEFPSVFFKNPATSVAEMTVIRGKNAKVDAMFSFIVAVTSVDVVLSKCDAMLLRCCVIVIFCYRDDDMIVKRVV